jgi:hypothetical protein
MSQGKKEVVVLDSSSGIRLPVAVDEARWNFLYKAFDKDCREKLAFDSFFRSAADASEGMAFLVSQLAYTEAQTYERDYQDVQYRDLIPVTSEAGPAASTVRYQVFDKVGQGKRIESGSKDIPYSDVSGAAVEIGVVSGGAGYRYSQLELLQAAQMIRPLPASRMEAAVEMAERHLNSVALLGEQSTLTGQGKFLGLLNQDISQSSNPSQYMVAGTNGTTGLTGVWNTPATATFDKVLADVNLGILQFWNNSNNTLLPDTFGVATACFTALATRYNSLGTRTLLQLLEESNLMTARTGKKLNIVPIYQANTAGVNGATRCVLYVNDPRRIVMHVPMAHRFLAPQPEGLDVSVPGWYRYAGVNLRYSYAMVYMDNMA